MSPPRSLSVPWSALGENGILVSPHTVMIPGLPDRRAQERFRARTRAMFRRPSLRTRPGRRSTAPRARRSRHRALRASFPKREGRARGGIRRDSKLLFPRLRRCARDSLRSASPRVGTSVFPGLSEAIRAPSGARTLWSFNRLVFDGYVPSSTNRFPHPWAP